MTRDTLKPRDQGGNEGFQVRAITQTKGLTFKGPMRQMAFYSTDNGKKQDWQELEIYETAKGGWVTVLIGMSVRTFRKATYFAEVRADDPAFQLAVWESLDWVTAARTMLRDQFRWGFVQDVE